MKRTRLKQLRQAGGYTQEILGKALGISGDYVNMIENERRTPGFRLAKQMADYFGVTVDELFFYDSGEQNIRKQ